MADSTQVIRLRDAKVGALVHGTGENSVYMCVAHSTAVNIAVRFIEGTNKLSVRVEPANGAKEFSPEAAGFCMQMGLQVQADAAFGQYASSHTQVPVVPAIMAVAAIMAAAQYVFDATVPSPEVAFKAVMAVSK